jgi:16S rRNA (guanine966-N2)-methyltransferase
MERFAERKYGETKLWFAEPGAEAGPDDVPEEIPNGVS